MVEFIRAVSSLRKYLFCIYLYFEFRASSELSHALLLSGATTHRPIRNWPQRCL